MAERRAASSFSCLEAYVVEEVSEGNDGKGNGKHTSSSSSRASSTRSPLMLALLFIFSIARRFEMVDFIAVRYSSTMASRPESVSWGEREVN